MHTLSQALLQARGRLPGSSETPAGNPSCTPGGTGKSEDPPETRKSRSFSTSRVYKMWLLTVAVLEVYVQVLCYCMCFIPIPSVFFNIQYHQLWVIPPLNFVHSPSKHPSAPIEERLNGSGQSEETPADAGATDQSSEANAGQAAAVQFPRVLRDDCSWSEISGEQEGVPVLQAGLNAQRQDVWWVGGDRMEGTPT